MTKVTGADDEGGRARAQRAASSETTGNRRTGTEWFFDLKRGIAVPAEERGPSEHMLGPYPTKGEAENWKSRVEQRNDAWEADDLEWDGEK